MKAYDDFLQRRLNLLPSPAPTPWRERVDWYRAKVLLVVWVLLAALGARIQAMPMIEAAWIEGDVLKLSVYTNPDMTFAVQYTDSFTPPVIWSEWTQFSDPGTFEVPISLSSNRFFRLGFGGVFGLNAVGYVTRVMQTGTNLIANPFQHSENRISSLIPQCPDGTRVLKYQPGWGGFEEAMYYDLLGEWDNTSMTLRPGQGAILINPGAPFTITFVGEISQGNLALALSAGYSLISSRAPLAYLYGFPAAEGDTVSTWDHSTGSYVTNTFVGGVWDSPPAFGVGESFWLITTAARTWEQEFTMFHGEVRSPLVIQSQPADQTVLEGESALFSVEVSGGSGSGPLIFQWRKDGMELVDNDRVSGATTRVLTIADCQMSDTGGYSVWVSDSDSTNSSQPAMLTVNAMPPEIVVQPVSQTKPAESQVSFGVEARGSLPLSYQWLKDGVSLAEGGRITGATAATLTVGMLDPSDSGIYAIRVSNRHGEAISAGAELTVEGLPPRITAGPANVTLLVGAGLMLGATATGTEPLEYRWLRDGVELLNDDRISGSDTRILSIAGCVPNDAGDYVLRVTSAYGEVFSHPARVTVAGVPPEITLEPADQAVTVGATAQFRVEAAGSEPLVYRWYLNGVPLVDGGSVSGTNTDTLTVEQVQEADAGEYTVVVSNAEGSVTSQIAVLTVSSAVIPLGDYLFRTFAGVPRDSGAADGVGSAARFNWPRYVAVDANGNVYVADTSNHTIRKVTPDGSVTTLAGSPGQRGSADGTGTAARFYDPSGLAVDAAGNVFVADRGNHTIRKITPAGTVTTLAGLAGVPGSIDGTGSNARFNLPGSLALDTTGRIWVGDFQNYTLRVVTSDGVVTTVAGSAGDAGTTDGPAADARFMAPGSLAVDAVGTLYIGDLHAVRRLDPDGMVTTWAGSPGNPGSDDGVGNAARLRFPAGLAVDSVGNVFVADYGMHTLRRISPEAEVVTVGGLAESSGIAEGVGSAARFDGPTGLAVDRLGNLYVADSENHRIVKGTPLILVAGPGSGDDFDRFGKDPVRWGSDANPYGDSNSRFHEANGRLEFTGSSLVLRPWIQSYASSTADWEVSVDAHLGEVVLPAPGSFVQVDLFVVLRPDEIVPDGFSGTWLHTSLQLYQSQVSGATGRGIQSGLSVQGVRREPDRRIATPSALVGLRTTFDASTKTLTSWYYPEGGSGGGEWIAVREVELEDPAADWELKDYSTFALWLAVSIEGVTVTPSDAVWLDNVRLDGAWSPIGPPGLGLEVAEARPVLELVGEPNARYALEHRADLSSGGWQTVSTAVLNRRREIWADLGTSEAEQGFYRVRQVDYPPEVLAEKTLRAIVTRVDYVEIDPFTVTLAFAEFTFTQTGSGDDGSGFYTYGRTAPDGAWIRTVKTTPDGVAGNVSVMHLRFTGESAGTFVSEYAGPGGLRSVSSGDFRIE